MKGKFEMTKRFEKELAEAETILSNYKKNLISYFDNPTSYNKLVSALMPIMQEQIKLIDDFRGNKSKQSKNNFQIIPLFQLTMT